MVSYEMIDKYGKHTPIPYITSLQTILAEDTNTLIARRMHLISIIQSKNGQTENWYFKPISETWYPESEATLEALSGEYRQMKLSRTLGHMWVLRNHKGEKMQEIDYKLHITKDISIQEYRQLFESLSIDKVINHQELYDLLSFN